MREVGREVKFELVTHDEIDPGLLFQGFHSRLSVAARYGDERMRRMFERLPNEVSRCPFGILRDGTGIEHKKVRRLSEFDQLEPFPSESFTENRGFSLIQPAAKRM